MIMEEYLEEYKTITLNLMNNNISISQINSFISKREEIIKILSESSFNKEAIKKNIELLNLLELEEQLKTSIKKEMVRIQEELARLKKVKQANTQYNNFENRARIFNKSI